MTMLSATAVSLEKRLIIRPRGLELKNIIEALATRLSIELWRELPRERNNAPIKKAVKPETKLYSLILQ